MANTKKSPTKAWLEAQQERDMMNKGRLCYKAHDLSSVVYFYTNDMGRACAIGYCGRARKPKFHTAYKDANRRFEAIKEWMERVSANSNKSKSCAKRTLEKGDVLSASWGYEQTNVDYYLVTKLVGGKSVELVEIGAISVDTEYMQGQCAPDTMNFQVNKQ